MALEALLESNLVSPRMLNKDHNRRSPGPAAARREGTDGSGRTTGQGLFPTQQMSGTGASATSLAAGAIRSDQAWEIS